MSAIDQISEPTFLELGEERNRRRIAFRRRFPTDAGKDRPGIVWLGGFKSDMLSTKVTVLDQWAGEQGRAVLRFDYSGHGESGGDFAKGTIGQWLEESLYMIRHQTTGPQILVGSSMGGWIAMLVARALAELDETQRIAGMVLIAPALDFTEELMWKQMSEEVRSEIMDKGLWMRASQYSPQAYPITRELIEDGRKHLLFGSKLRSYGPVHILQGMQDPDVPPNHSMKLVHHLGTDPVSLTLIKDGDHRLSREEDIARLISAVEKIA